MKFVVENETEFRMDREAGIYGESHVLCMTIPRIQESASGVYEFIREVLSDIGSPVSPSEVTVIDSENVSPQNFEIRIKEGLEYPIIQFLQDNGALIEQVG